MSRGVCQRTRRGARSPPGPEDREPVADLLLVRSREAELERVPVVEDRALALPLVVLHVAAPPPGLGHVRGELDRLREVGGGRVALAGPRPHAAAIGPCPGALRVELERP